MNVALERTVGSLFGRDRECERVRSVLLAAASGNRQVAVISGELGVGKTTLVTQVLQSVDMHTLVGHCLPVEGEAMPFAPVMASLRDLLRDLTADASAAPLVGPRRSSTRCARLLGRLGEPCAVASTWFPCAGRARHGRSARAPARS